MKIRPKLMLAIIGLMGVYFLLAALLLEARHLDRMQRRREDLGRYVQCALDGAVTPRAVAIRLNALVRFGYVRDWFVTSADDEGESDSHALGEGRGLVNDTGPLIMHWEFGTNDEQIRIYVRLRDPSYGAIGGDLHALFVATVFGAILLSVTIYLLVSRMVLAPVEEMLLATHRLASGSMPMPLRLAHRSDEIGRLAGAFESMSREVRESHETLEERVRQATERIKATERELAFSERLAATGRLAAGVAHEINNPLGGVMNAISRLRRDDLSDSKREEYLDLVEDGLGRIREIVLTILDFSRHRPTIEVLDPSIPLERSLDLCRHRLEAMSIDLSWERESSLCQTRIDGGELQQVFLNLLTNAIDAMPDGGTLRLHVDSTGDGVLIEITDTGVGMDADELLVSFDYFHTSKPAGAGTGLGLSISHNIVTRFGGRLTLESLPGKGTTARVWLPRFEEATKDKDTHANSTGG